LIEPTITLLEKNLRTFAWMLRIQPSQVYRRRNGISIVVQLATGYFPFPATMPATD